MQSRSQSISRGPAVLTGVYTSRFEPLSYMLGLPAVWVCFAATTTFEAALKALWLSGRKTRGGSDDDHYHRIQKNTDRIARIARNVVICRAFLRSVHSVVYRPLMEYYRPPRQIPPADRPCGNKPFGGSLTLT